MAKQLEENLNFDERNKIAMQKEREILAAEQAEETRVQAELGEAEAQLSKQMLQDRQQELRALQDRKLVLKQKKDRELLRTRIAKAIKHNKESR